MWSWLRSRRFNGWKFRRQHPVGKYCLDFYCLEALLNVELDGFQHGFRKQQEHDRERQVFLDSLGIKTLRFWNGQLRRERQLVRDAIYRELQARAPEQPV
jgi:ATP-dependent helicase HrpA/adenine-specific DNA-methyltransferase